MAYGLVMYQCLPQTLFDDGRVVVVPCVLCKHGLPHGRAVRVVYYETEEERLERAAALLGCMPFFRMYATSVLDGEDKG